MIENKYLCLDILRMFVNKNKDIYLLKFDID